MEVVENIIKILAIVTFIKAVFEYVKGLNWKKSEFLTKEIKDFLNDPKIKSVCLMLDYNKRFIEINSKSTKIDDDFLIQALKTHEEKQIFTPEEAFVRDLFDDFFDKLGFFNIYIKQDLVNRKEVNEYLQYYMDIVCKPGRKPKELVDIFTNYIEYYDFKNAKELLTRV